MQLIFLLQIITINSYDILDLDLLNHVSKKEHHVVPTPLIWKARPSEYLSCHFQARQFPF